MFFVIKESTPDHCVFVFVAHFGLMDVSIKACLPIATTMLQWCNPRMHVIVVIEMLIAHVETHILNVACFAISWFLFLLSCIECNSTFTFPTISNVAMTSFWLQWFGLIVDNSLCPTPKLTFSFVGSHLQLLTIDWK